MRLRWLGRVPYREAWAVQRSISRHSTDDYLLLMEHPPVYTLGRNAGLGHVLVDPATVGAELVRVDRGGDVTFHGPGQLIGYPVITLGPGPHHGRAHVHRVEQVVIDALVHLGLPAGHVGRLPGYPGVWVGLDEHPAAGWAGPRKIAAVGVRTARGRTTHGFALNVTTDLRMFGHIVPCGIPDRPVTSLAAEGLTCGLSEAWRRWWSRPKPSGVRWRTSSSSRPVPLRALTSAGGPTGRSVPRPGPETSVAPRRSRWPWADGPMPVLSSVDWSGPGSTPTPAWPWTSASRRGSGSRSPWGATTSASSRGCVTSISSQCVRRPAVPTSMSAGPTAPPPS